MGFPIFSDKEYVLLSFFWSTLSFVLESSCGAAKEGIKFSFKNSVLPTANIYYIIYLYLKFRQMMAVLHS